MGQLLSCSGQEFRDMFIAGSNWLEKSVSDINAINVFPVPDGDTGTNMLLTMRSTLEETSRASGSSVSEIAKAMAYGALMGARGNSGVILSQFFRGLADALDEKESITGADWASALNNASRIAYKAVSQPVEGTMLTVMRDVSMAAELAAQSNPNDMTRVTESATDAAKDSVAKTPLLLDVLREAGVVDAGGQGIYILLDGILRYLKGEMEELQYRKPQMVSANLSVGSAGINITDESEEPYGYCTNFLLEGDDLDMEAIRGWMEDKGQSLVIVGDEKTIRVHIHSYEPGDILQYATSLGTLHQIQIQNMDDQHVGFVEMQQEKMPSTDISVVVVAAGIGMKEVFQSLGAAAVVPGGQTMNPSVQEVLQAVESISSQKIILLPNNKNIILTASQIQSLTDKDVAVVPTKTLPQGIAALLAFNYEGSLDENASAMNEAAATVKTVEITRAVRSTQIKGLRIKKGQVIGILDDDNVVAAGNGVGEVLLASLEKAGIEAAEVVTLYYGVDVDVEQAEKMLQQMQDKYPGIQVDMIRGGQPNYEYIISLE